MFMIFILSINTIVNAKYIIEKEINIANLNIDRSKPKIELEEIKNTNINFEKYANKTHTITLKIRITEKNIKEINLNKKNIVITVENKEVELENFKIEKLEEKENSKIYKIELKEIKGNGNLKVQFKEGTVVDKSELTNDVTDIDTKINIDNIPPIGVFSESKIENGKVNAKITLNENIRDIEGWKKSNDKLTLNKEFTNNISYELPITDYAGNTSKVEVNVTKATYINITYASHNSLVGWTFGYGNYDIAGKEAVLKNPIYKTEALAFNIDGNIEKDFVQAKTYIYTHWGEGSFAKCNTQGIIYNYGYNPINSTFKSMKSTDLTTINGKKYFQFGGSGINGYMNTDINGNNPIPANISWQYPYGISGIMLKLKDYSQFSIVYQILVNKVGWTKAYSDGQECIYNYKMPMSAIRVTLIPKSEKKYVIDTWNKDTGTYNLK